MIGVDGVCRSRGGGDDSNIFDEMVSCTGQGLQNDALCLYVIYNGDS